MTNNLKKFFLSLLKKGGIGLIASLTLPAIVLAVTTIGTNIDTGGIVTVAGDLNASSTSYLSHTIPALNNAYDLGSATSSWSNIYASGTLRISTSILSSTNNTLDLGGFGNAINDVFASGTVYGATIFNSGNINASGTTYLSHTIPASNNAWDLGSGTSSWRNVYASGTLYLNTSILSSTNNIADLGGFGNAFRDIYSSSSIRVGNGIGASSTFSASGNLTLGGATGGGIFPATGNVLDLGASSTPWRSISASTSIRLGRQNASTTLDIASNSATSAKGQGTCIALRAVDGTLVYLSVTSTQSAAMPWTALAVSTRSCE